MTVGNLTIEQLTNIISNIFNKKFDEKFDQKFDEKIKPIIDEISLIKQKMVTKHDVIEIIEQRLKPIENDVKEMKENIKMLKSFHIEDIKKYKVQK
ncbi:hypothetical protein ACJA27_01235 [Mycoplasmopsis lipophila]|uniref:hypothetical protein n=1 Tax=Mycoplasmopsis lipophila TaxID=2117 RepID=UPI003872D9C5